MDSVELAISVTVLVSAGFKGKGMCVRWGLFFGFAVGDVFDFVA